MLIYSHIGGLTIYNDTNSAIQILLCCRYTRGEELLYAKCISEDEYHASKRPLLQRLAVQGAEIEARDVIVAGAKESSVEEWSVIDLKDERCFHSKQSSDSKNKSKQGSSMKQLKGDPSVFSFTRSHKNGKAKENKSVTDQGTEHFGPNDRNIATSVSTNNEVRFSTENPFWDSHLRQQEKESQTKSILMSESLPPESIKVEKQSGGEKTKKKPFRTLFQREGHGPDSEERGSRLGKKQWGFDGFKKWKKSEFEDETAPLSLCERSDGETYLGQLVPNPIGEGPDTKQIKRKLHSNVLGENIKKELSRIQEELSTTNQSVQFSNDQIEAISTRLPMDKADQKMVFPKSSCDRYGDVVRKEFKDHVGEMGNLQNASREKHNSKRWATFDDDENCHPNLFAPHVHSIPVKQLKYTPSMDADRKSTDKCFKYNPFFDD